MFLKRHINKKERYRLIKKKASNNLTGKITVGPNVAVTKTGDGNKIYTFNAPKKMSIIGTPIDTLRFFDEIVNVVNNGKGKLELYLNFKNVEYLTIDAIMYTIALMNNIKTKLNQHINFRGNFPDNRDAAKLMVECGFTKFVEANQSRPKPRKEYIQIVEGHNAAASTAKEVCDFVSDYMNIKDKFLYKMLIELMANAYNHAYDNTRKHSSRWGNKKWYIFVENKEDRICFTFLDTGLGIPGTVYKKIREKISYAMRESDIQYIISALTSDALRTQTKLKYRGKGLPKINKIYQNGDIQNLTIVSGKGYCGIKDNKYDLPNRLNGTLVYWEIFKLRRKET